MDNSCPTPPRLSPCPIALGGPFSLSPPGHHISLPLSPISFPPSPTSLSPATADSLRSSSSPLSNCSASHHPEAGPPPITSDQDDLTCLSWLHQRGNLLPLQPLSKAPTPLAQLESTGQHPASAKPPYSFSSLIFMAIEDSPDKRLPVKDIYGWIVDNFPYYRTASAGWRNSVRHNLSLSKSFCRMERDKSQSVGKGSLWCVSPEHRAALLEVLRKTHTFHGASRNLTSEPPLLDGVDYGVSAACDSMDMSDSLSPSLMLTPSLASDNPTFDEHPDFPLTPDHEELVAIEPVEYQQEELGGDLEKDPLSDSGYIELHYYQSQEYQYLVLPDDSELDLETVEILQLDAEAQEAAGSLLDLAGGGY
uniref:forkhead box protein N2 n=1 Tax=Doryrhamphus excisus TaxID=161450 RepID=UPI0025ADC29D|nr:forkhead box protein N2 [Doryrhamphus excisus]XP_057918637.1 forkhead box protein N2 [Doryrhamphus excisus]